MSEVTRILSAIGAGDRAAADESLSLVYGELRILASGRVNRWTRRHWLTRRTCDSSVARTTRTGAHLFAAAAEAMRRILINRARDPKRLKRGGDQIRLDLSDVTVTIDTPDEILLELDRSLQLRDPDRAARKDALEAQGGSEERWGVLLHSLAAGASFTVASATADGRGSRRTYGLPSRKT